MTEGDHVETKTVSEAGKGEEIWNLAMNDESKALQENKNWDQVSSPTARDAVQKEWV